MEGEAVNVLSDLILSDPVLGIQEVEAMVTVQLEPEIDGTVTFVSEE